MHRMLRHLRILDRQESPGPDVQAYSFHVNAFFTYFGEHGVCKMEPCGRSSYRTAYSRIESLITLRIDRFAVPVEIWWNRNRSADFQHIGERQISVPMESNDTSFTFTRNQISRHVQLCSLAVMVFWKIQIKCIILPLLGISYDTFPCAGLRRSECKVIFNRVDGLETENLYPSPCRAHKM